MNNRYHERLCQISIHCYREGVCVCVCVWGAIIAPFIFFSLSQKNVCAILQQAWIFQHGCVSVSVSVSVNAHFYHLVLHPCFLSTHHNCIQSCIGLKQWVSRHIITTPQLQHGTLPVDPNRTTPIQSFPAEASRRTVWCVEVCLKASALHCTAALNGEKGGGGVHNPIMAGTWWQGEPV